MALETRPGCPGVLFLGTTRGVYVSENDGYRWTRLGTDLPRVPVTNLVFENTKLYASTFGRGLWRCSFS